MSASPEECLAAPSGRSVGGMAPWHTGGLGPLAALETRDCLPGGTIALITLISGGKRGGGGVGWETGKCCKKSSNSFFKPQELSDYPGAILEEHLPCKSSRHRVPLNIQLTKGL